MIHASAILKTAALKQAELDIQALSSSYRRAKLRYITNNFEHIWKMASASSKIAADGGKHNFVSERLGSIITSVTALLHKRFQDVQQVTGPLDLHRAPIDEKTGAPDFTGMSKSICYKILNALKTAGQNQWFEDAVQDWCELVLNAKPDSIKKEKVKGDKSVSEKGSRERGYSEWPTMFKKITTSDDPAKSFQQLISGSPKWFVLDWMNNFYKGERSNEYRCPSCAHEFKIKKADDQRKFVTCPSCGTQMPFNATIRSISTEGPVSGSEDSPNVRDLLPDDTTSDAVLEAENRSEITAFREYLNESDASPSDKKLLRVLWDLAMEGGGKLTAKKGIPPAVVEKYPALGKGNRLSTLREHLLELYMQFKAEVMNHPINKRVDKLRSRSKAEEEATERAVEARKEREADQAAELGYYGMKKVPTKP